jgi:lipopolysaccharide export system protein LptC
MRKVRRSFLLLAILVSLGGVTYKVAEIIGRMQEQITANPLTALDYLPESTLRIKDFHRSKIEDGRKVWELFGEEASYYKEQKEAVIKKPKFFYNDKELERMELRGDIEVSFQGYVLKSEEANYLPAKDQIVLPSHTTVVGEGIAVEGSRMEIELEEKKIRLIQAVKTKIEPEKLSKKKTMAGSSPRVGG